MTPQFAIAVRPVNAVRLEDAETVDIDVYDIIGDWWGEGVAAKDVLAKLRAAKDAKQINVRINSGGGDAHDGNAIYNLLSQHEAKVVVDVDGLAASAASLIAMAGDEIRMSETALMMIHNPWTWLAGESSELRQAADKLDKLRDSLANAYIQRTGLSRERVIELLDAETWMTAEEAVELGFATSITPAKKAAAMLRSELDLSRFSKLDGERAELANRIARSAAPQALFDVQISGVGKTAAEIAAVIRKETERVLAAQGRSQETNPPAPTEPPKPNPEESTMTVSKKLIQALNLADDADEAAVLSAVERLKLSAQTGDEIEKLLGETGGKAIGAVKALKETKAAHEELAKDLGKVKATMARRDFETARDAGLKDRKLTPATAKFYTDRFEAALAAGQSGETLVEELQGFLQHAPRLPGGAAVVQPVNQDGTSGPAQHNGKAFEDMRPIDRHTLKQSNPELYETLRADAVARNAI